MEVIKAYLPQAEGILPKWLLFVCLPRSLLDGNALSRLPLCRTLRSHQKPTEEEMQSKHPSAD